MLLFTSSFFALIVSLTIINVDCTSEAKSNLTNEISSIYFNIKEFQKSLKEDNRPSIESVAKIVKDLSSILILMMSHLESSKSFESAFVTKMQNLSSEMEGLRKDMNETECSLSIRIIDIENDISKLKKGTEKGTEIVLGSLSNSSIEIAANEGETLMNIEYFLTPPLPYLQARLHCFEHDGFPFVPKTKDDFFNVVGKLTIEDDFGWLPLNDILIEERAEWEDGTSYDEGPVHFKFADISIWGNTDLEDCVAVNKQAVGDWYHCSAHARKMLCFKN